jgi:hypothetical protein
VACGDIAAAHTPLEDEGKCSEILITFCNSSKISLTNPSPEVLTLVAAVAVHVSSLFSVVSRRISYSKFEDWRWGVLGVPPVLPG